MAARRKTKAKTRVKKAVRKVKAAIQKVAAKATARRKKKRAKRRAVPAIEPPHPGGASGKPAGHVGHAPLPKRPRASPALSIAGGGIAVPRRR